MWYAMSKQGFEPLSLSFVFFDDPICTTSGAHAHCAQRSAKNMLSCYVRPDFPVCCRYGIDGWEVVYGYDQEKMMGDRAGAALVLDLMEVDKKQRTPAMSVI